MNEYLITFQCKYEDGIFTTSDVFSSRFPLCKELVQSINEYIENKFKTKAFSILNIVCLSKQEDLENEIPRNIPAFGRLIRRYRILTDDRLYDMARRLNIPSSVLCAYETGNKEPPESIIDAIAEDIAKVKGRVRNENNRKN